MRAVDKGINTTVYSKYENALEDLTTRLGHYCSYCEMGVNNMIEVEHVHPVHNGGNELSWDNFLLACKYCNTVKSNNNANRLGYLWPDIDNTDLLFNYTLNSDVLEIKTTLSNPHKAQALALLNLVGLNRYPKSANRPTKKDKRWRLRDEAIITAKNSYNNWSVIRNDTLSPYRILIARQIAETSLIGFYSVWFKIFEDESTVLAEIDLVWKNRYNNYKEYNVGTTVRTVRFGGQI